jgi:putative tricarboxylic transport membrane protein
VKTTTRDGIAAAALLLVAAVAIHQAGALPFGTVRAPGEGFFPWWLGVALAGLALGLAAQARRAPGTGRTGRGHVGRVLALLAVLGAYSLALEPLGYPICTFLLVLFTVAPGSRGELLAAVAVALLASGGSYLLFGVWLEVPLPAGPFFR